MSTRTNSLPTFVCATEDWAALALTLPPWPDLAARATGEIVTDHRSSWVRRVRSTMGCVFVKTYDYPSVRSRLRNFGRFTAPFRASRPARERTAMLWLSAHGVATARPLAVAEWRSMGFLQRACLVTTALAGRPADQALEHGSPHDRAEIGAAILTFVDAVHRLGFRDRNLDLRNLLVERTGASWRVAKIDSPRHRIVGPGEPCDRLAAADWRRLLPQLAAFGIARDQP